MPQTLILNDTTDIESAVYKALSCGQNIIIISIPRYFKILKCTGIYHTGRHVIVHQTSSAKQTLPIQLADEKLCRNVEKTI
jgi:hypothetical protein